MLVHTIEALHDEQAHGLDDVGHVAADVVAHDRALVRDHLLAERILELVDAAALQNLLVTLDLAEQGLLRRYRVDVARVDVEVAGGFFYLPFDFGLDRARGLELVPQAVDLVEHRKAALVGAMFRVADEVVPHLNVGFGNAGVGREDEQHRVRRGQQRQRQFRLGAERVETRRVEDHQPLIEQRVREVDNRVPPLWHFHQPLGGEVHAVLGFFLGNVQAHGLRRFFRHGLDFGDVLQGLGDLVRRLDVERVGDPFLGKTAQFGKAGTAAACLDRQQADTGRAVFFMHQLGRAHGGAPGARRQHALAKTGKENGVDQFGFSARELGDEGHVQLVVTQRGQNLFQALVDLKVGEFLTLQPAAEAAHGREQALPPGAVGLKMLVKFGHVRRPFV